MNQQDWLHVVIELTSLIGYSVVFVTVGRSLWSRRRSTTTLTLQLFGALAFAGATTHAVQLFSTWWPVGWLNIIGRIIAAISVLLVSWILVRLIPRTVDFRDGEQLTAAAEELRQSRDRFERALEGSSSGLWEWNIVDGEVWFAPRFRELLGYGTEEEFPNDFSSWEKALHPDDRQRVMEALDGHLHRQDTYDVEYRMSGKSGEYRWFSARGVAVRRADGHPYLMAGSIQDIDGRKRAEQTLRRTEEYLSQKHKMESLGELASGTAHEFNNMLQAISGQIQFAERLVRGNSRAKTELAAASTLIDRASSITRRLLVFSHTNLSDRQRIRPNDVVTQLSTVLRPVLPKRIKLRIRRRRNIGRVFADPVSLQQALMNLCINARDTMPKGGTLTVATSRTEIPSHGNSRFPDASPGRYVKISVTDTGSGISDSIRSRVFEPFFSTKHPGKGTGLGLAIASNVIKEHDGFIDLHSRLGEGTTFTVWLPAAKQLRQPGRTEPTVRSPAALANGRFVLYAEDEPLVRRDTVRLLRQHGYRVLPARDGKHALELFQRNIGDIDVALLDIAMPHLDGLDVFRELRQTRQTLPIVFCTGHASRIHHGQIPLAEDTCLVEKPFKPEALLTALADAVSSGDQIEGVPS